MSLDSVHTFVVGDVQAVMHNCPDTSSFGGSSGPSDTLSPDDIRSAEAEMKDQMKAGYDTTDDWTIKSVENNGAPRATNDPRLAGYPNRYYFQVGTPMGTARISGDFDPVSRTWGNEPGFHLSGDQLEYYWQMESDIYHGLLN